jgi:hypothetical protein
MQYANIAVQLCLLKPSSAQFPISSAPNNPRFYYLPALYDALEQAHEVMTMTMDEYATNNVLFNRSAQPGKCDMGLPDSPGGCCVRHQPTQQLRLGLSNTHSLLERPSTAEHDLFVDASQNHTSRSTLLHRSHRWLLNSSIPHPGCHDLPFNKRRE